MSGMINTKSRNRFSVALPFIALSVLFSPLVARAATIVCDGEVQSVLVFTRGASEGLVVAKLKLDNGSAHAWSLCNLNEDKFVNGVATSKDGKELFAAQESYAATCKALLSSAQIAKATSKKLRLAFLDTVFATCADVPSWGGLVGADNDDPAGRLGAWDGLYYAEVLHADVAAP